MTLQQAHEIQRRELISLRAENKRLKEQASGTFPSVERDALERRVRQLEQQIKNETKRHEDARAYWKITKDHCLDQAVEIVDLKEQIASLQEENEALRIRAEKAEAEVCMLNGTNKKLERRLNVSFENSSLPSSAQPFRKKIPNGRKATGRKPGAQPGHKHHSAERLLPTKSPVHLDPPDEIIRDADVYDTGRTIVKQFIDVSFVVTVQDYVADEYRNRVTGARLHAPFPAGVVNPVIYGASVKALAFLLNNYYNVSMAKTRQCISDLTKGIVSLSTGTICNLASEFSAATENPHGIPKEKVRELTEKYDYILELADDEYSRNPPSAYYPNGYNLQKRLREFKEDHLFFLKHPKVDYTNNISERGLRKFKRKQKQAVVLRSDSGGRHICDALTIIETARLQHKNIYSTIEAAFSK